MAESPGMGLGLQDHPAMGCSWACADPVSLKDALDDDNLARWAPTAAAR